MLGTATYPSLKSRNVFVTGGATGIGAALVRAFAGQGARVAFVDLAEEPAMLLCRQVAQETGELPLFRRVDVRDVAALQDCIARALGENDSIDVLINNVGDDRRHAAEEVTPETWRDGMAVNLDAAFFASQAALAGMKRTGRGAIVNFGSINALLGPPQMPGYVAAKAGIMGLTKALAREWGRFGIRVNAILPGWVATERQLSHWLTPEAEREWMSQVALPGRLLAEDIAALALFLAADDSRMITGQSFVVDAGRT